MEYKPITKPAIEQFAVEPNLGEYDGARQSITWEQIRSELDGHPGGGLNIAYECLDRHLKTNRRDKVAMIWEGKDGEQETYTFEQFTKAANRVPNGRRAPGVETGERVFMFTDCVPAC